MPPSNAKGGGGLYERLVVTRPPGTSKFRSMRQDLALFEADDLYAYACPTSAQNPRLASSEALIARAEQRVQDWMRNTSERSAAERLCSRAREVFADDVERRRYDDYLQWCDLKAVFDGLDARLNTAASTCSADDVAQEIARLEELLGSSSQAMALMESYLAARGIELVAGQPHQASVSAANGAEARPDAAAYVLPDSAFEPSVPEPPRAHPAPAQQPQVGALGTAAMQRQAAFRQPANASAGANAYADGRAYVSANAYVGANASAGAVRCATCGAANPADMSFCLSCGNPIKAAEFRQAQPIVGAGSRSAQRSASAKRASSVPTALIVVLVVAAVAIAGLAAYWAVNGGLPFTSQASSAASESSSSSDSATKRLKSNSVNAVTCSPKTKFVPLAYDERPFETYKVALNPIGTGRDVKATLSVDGTGGFTIADFNDPNTASENVKAGTYKLIMTNEKTGIECTVTVDYHPTGSADTSIVEVIALS